MVSLLAEETIVPGRNRRPSVSNSNTCDSVIMLLSICHGGPDGKKVASYNSGQVNRDSNLPLERPLTFHWTKETALRWSRDKICFTPFVYIYFLRPPSPFQTHTIFICIYMRNTLLLNSAKHHWLQLLSIDVDKVSCPRTQPHGCSMSRKSEKCQRASAKSQSQLSRTIQISGYSPYCCITS